MSTMVCSTCSMVPSLARETARIAGSVFSASAPLLAEMVVFSAARAFSSVPSRPASARWTSLGVSLSSFIAVTTSASVFVGASVSATYTPTRSGSGGRSAAAAR